jgi:hypothetical protein
MFNNIIYKLCDKVIAICESIKCRIKNTANKDWVNKYSQWKSRINKNDTDNIGNTNTTNTKIQRR